MRRIVLFLATNLAILTVLGILLQVFGVGSILKERGEALDVQALLILCAVIGMGGSFVSLALSKWTAKRLPGLRVLEGPANPTERWLVETVRQQAHAAGIGMPEVAVFASDEPNAFATGARRDRALVAVSDGLLRSMKREEIEAVLGHEISHVANGDMVTLTLIQGVLNTFVLALARVAGFAVDRIVFRTEGGHGPAFLVVTLVCQLVFGILASLIVFWFSRHREFRADAGGARLSGRNAMISALDRLRKVADPQPLPDSLAALGIQGRRGFARLFSTHPSLEDRIDALRSSSLRE
jgi:heat shock protein HtpX